MTMIQFVFIVWLKYSAAEFLTIIL